MTVNQHAAQAGTPRWLVDMVKHMRGWTDETRVSLQEYAEAVSAAAKHEVRQVIEQARPQEEQ